MIAVGVRDLKNQLSRYLQYVKQGEKVFITEHNRVIAELSLPHVDGSDNDIKTVLETLAATGKLTKATRNRSISINNKTPADIDWISVYQDNRTE